MYVTAARGTSTAGMIYRSDDYGGSWDRIRPADIESDDLDWECSHVSKNGQYVFKGASSRGIYASSDYGMTWTLALNSNAGFPGTIKWIRCMDSGQYCIALFAPGNIYNILLA